MQHPGSIFRTILILSVFPTHAFPAGQLVPSDMVRGMDALDIESIDANITFALDTLNDAGSQSWTSYHNTAEGHITIIRSFEFESSMCRKIEIVSKQIGFTSQRKVSFCQGEDLDWQPLRFRLQNAQ